MMAINSPNGKEKADLAVLEILKNGPPDVPGGLYKRRFVCFSCWFSQGRSGNMYLIKHKNLRDGRDETFSQILRRVILPLPASRVLRVRGEVNAGHAETARR